MSKNKKQKQNQEALEEEVLKGFFETDEVEAVLPVEEVLEESVASQNGSKSSKNVPTRMKVTVVRAYIFAYPKLTSRSVAAVSFGNLLNLLDEGDSDSEFFKVRVPRSESPIDGYILRTKVKKI